jgi:hypothetical protein
MKRILPVVLLIVVFLPQLVAAQSGQAGLSFLKNGVGARSVAMGNAGVTSADLGAAMYYNPALLADDEQASISIDHNEWIQDITTEYIGVSLPLDGWTFGLSLGLTSVSGIELRDTPSPEPDGYFDSQNFAGGVTVAFSVGTLFDFGVNAKYIFEKIHVDDASGYAFDFGISTKPFRDSDLADLRFGVALANLGSMSDLNTMATELPTLMRYGAGYAFPVEALKSSVNVEVSGLTLLEEETTHANIGVEFDYVNMVFLRLGYRSGFDDKDISFGAGARYSSLRFDYAFVPFKESFGNAHTIALSIML